MCEFIDRAGRVIIINSEDPNEIEAVFESEVIGRFIFNEVEFEMGGGYTDFYLELIEMYVKSDFQRSGLGTRLMEEAVKVHEKFELPDFHFSGKITDGNKFTEEGFALVASCFEKGILTEKFRKKDCDDDGEEWYTDNFGEKIERFVLNSGYVNKSKNIKIEKDTIFAKPANKKDPIEINYKNLKDEWVKVSLSLSELSDLLAHTVKIEDD